MVSFLDKYLNYQLNKFIYHHIYFRKIHIWHLLLSWIVSKELFLECLTGMEDESVRSIVLRTILKFLKITGPLWRVKEWRNG